MVGEAYSVQTLCSIPITWRSWRGSARELFEVSSPALDNVPAVVQEMRHELNRHPTLIPAWQGFSEDTRSTPAPYLAGNEVGDFDATKTSVVVHAQEVDACIDYIFRRVFRRKLNDGDFA